MLDRLLEEYNEIQKQEVEVSAKKSELKEAILEEMANLGVNDYISTDGSLKANVATKTSFKYTDETGIIEYLKGHDMNQYLKVAIDTTSFNKQLKTSATLQESLSGKFNRSESPALTVKNI